MLHVGNDTATGREHLLSLQQLTTHAVIVGQTGSGKTGLVVCLMEELLALGIPVLAIDPKGDLANIMLQLRTPAEFAAWSPDPEQESRAHARGLDEWCLQPRARLLRRHVDRVRVFTPASTAGVPLSVMRSLAAPQQPDRELLLDRISSTTSALLALLGVRGAQLPKARALIGAIIEHHWSQGESLDLHQLVDEIQDPPFPGMMLGAQDVDAFLTPRRRANLASQVNTILAEPKFELWLQGEALDIQSMLYDGDTPRMSVVNIAHLDESERQFIVTLLLSEYIAHMRTQPGVDMLQSAIVLDEAHGYLPPVREPATKRPLMTLLKTARAYGTGLVLASQNPVDLDYKALSNAGTWFIGRLQAERDKKRLLDGMPDTPGIGRLISSLGKRTFAVHSTAHEEPVRMLVRYACSYLRGPFTRAELQRLLGTESAALNGNGVEAKLQTIERQVETIESKLRELHASAQDRASNSGPRNVILFAVGNVWMRTRALCNALPQASEPERRQIARYKLQLDALERSAALLRGGEPMTRTSAG